MRGASVGHAPHLHAATAPIACCARLCEAMRAAPTRVYTTNTASDAQIWTFCRPPMKHTGKSRMTSKSQHTTTTTIIIIIRCWHFWHAKLRSTSIGIGIYIRSRFVAWHDDDGTWKKNHKQKKPVWLNPLTSKRMLGPQRQCLLFCHSVDVYAAGKYNYHSGNHTGGCCVCFLRTVEGGVRKRSVCVCFFSSGERMNGTNFVIVNPIWCQMNRWLKRKKWIWL